MNIKYYLLSPIIIRTLVLSIVFFNTAFIQAQVRIAVSKTAFHYENWLRTADSTVIPVPLYSLRIDSALIVLSTCKGLLLTGGEDVAPVNYHKEDEIGKCEAIDSYRDSLEFALIKKAIAMGIPVFGICRGEQILNVALGGTLYTDIPRDLGTAVIHRCPEGSPECLHQVSVSKNSLLYAITNQQSGLVNSYHHQAVNKIAPGLRITARADNGVAEAIESDNSTIHSFVVGVQWHPERLVQNPLLSKPLAIRFLDEARKIKTSR